jgi:hypothetical protein
LDAKIYISNETKIVKTYFALEGPKNFRPPSPAASPPVWCGSRKKIISVLTAVCGFLCSDSGLLSLPGFDNCKFDQAYEGAVWKHGFICPGGGVRYLDNHEISFD